MPAIILLPIACLPPMELHLIKAPENWGPPQLWHAADRGIDEALPENSMDVDPVTDSDALAWMCYDALIGSEFERNHGWHVNLLPASVLKELPEGWEVRAARRAYGNLTVIIPAPSDILAPKLRRNEPRDRAHAAWAKQLGMV